MREIYLDLYIGSDGKGNVDFEIYDPNFPAGRFRLSFHHDDVGDPELRESIMDEIEAYILGISELAMEDGEV